MAWYIKYGMGGGYGGIEYNDWEETEAADENEANELAFQAACEDFESSSEFDYDVFYEENPDATEDELDEAFLEERESWIVYDAEWFEKNPNN